MNMMIMNKPWNLVHVTYQSDTLLTKSYTTSNVNIIPPKCKYIYKTSANSKAITIDNPVSAW